MINHSLLISYLATFIAFFMPVNPSGLENIDPKVQELISILDRNDSTFNDLMYKNLSTYSPEKLYDLAHKIYLVDSQSVSKNTHRMMALLPAYYIARNAWYNIPSNIKKDNVSVSMSEISIAMSLTRQSMLDYDLAEKTIALTCMYLFRRFDNKCSGVINLDSNKCYSSEFLSALSIVQPVDLR